MTNQAKLFFHLCLPGLLCPAAGLPLTWSLTLAARLNPAFKADAEHARWTKRIFRLAVLDTVLVLLMAGVVVPKQLETLGGPVAIVQPGAPGPRIGVLFDPSTTVPRVDALTPGFPAERAGVKPGDLIVAVGGTPASTQDETRRLIRESATPTVTLRISRGGEQLTLDVTTTTEAIPPADRALFAPETTSCHPLRRGEVPWGLVAVAFAMALLYVVGRGKGAKATLLFVAIGLLAAAGVAGGVGYAACVSVGGMSRGAFLLSLVAQTVLVLFLGLLLRKRVPEVQLPGGTASWLQTAALGGLYMFSGGLRMGLVLLCGKLLSGASAEGLPLQSSELGAFVASGLGTVGTIVFVITVALIAPIGEEWLFRGVVLPWLAGWMKPSYAIVLSGALFAALHLYYGVFVGVIFVYGVVLGWVRMKSGTLKAPILLHATLNTLAAIVLLLGIGR